MTSTMNGQKRPSLSEQINRLDRTLDGLADGLNEAVADAVKDVVGHAVREAIQAVLTEVLSNPQLLARLAPATNVSEPKQPEPPRLRERLHQLWAGVCSCIAAVQLACSSGAQSVRTKIGNGWSRMVECVQTLWSHTEIIRHFKYQILLASGIGIVSGIVVWYASPWIGAVMSGIGGFVTTVAVQGGLWLRRTFSASAVPNP